MSFIGINHLDILGELYGFMALYTAYEMIDDYHTGYLVDLSLYNIDPYFNPIYNSYITSPNSLAQDISSNFNKEWYPGVEGLSNITIVEDVLYFESWAGGELNAYFGDVINDKGNYPSDISFGNNFHFVINRTSGLVYGSGIRGWVEGTINNTNVKVCLTCEYRLEGFSLPEYIFGTYKNFFESSTTNPVSLNSMIVPSALILIIILQVFILRFSKRSKIWNILQAKNSK